MRHNRRTKRFGRTPAERRAMLENMVASLLIYQRIQTTLEKAKEARRLADHVIHLGKTNTVTARRQVFSYLQDRTLTSKLFKEISPRFKERPGGYTRILQLGKRKGDGAQLALLELTEKEIIIKEPIKKKSKKESVPEKPGHAHEHKHDKPVKGDEALPASKSETEKEKIRPKHPEQKKEKRKGGFFKNLSQFFRNKGGS